MEGPTPVSALIHAATMVTAGIFLIIKCSVIFELCSNTLILIAFWGAITSIFAASSGLFLSDIKQIIAYSTCSQLGYMVFICGISYYNIGLFHLMNHAIFKAALFLCAGAIIHSLNDEQDIRNMGKLFKILPLTYSCLLIASFAITGFPFLTGFYSKDLILENAYSLFGSSGIIFYIITCLTAFCTAFYSIRIIKNTFFNQPLYFFNYNKTLHESPIFISFVLFFLGLGSIYFGYFFKEFIIGFDNLTLTFSIFQKLKNFTQIEFEYINPFIKLIPLIITLFGIFFFFYYHYIIKKIIFFYNIKNIVIFYFVYNK
jgi:NADH:ubiquinone oxidoreductase subunit 5 (subunit L)/multisubunit Na+/H+ antiporter MnhA subunit